MPEILTESFCERCGTRYTFESVAPRKTRRLGHVKTLSKGVKNWVMSDDSSLDEAMAAARGDEERALTAHQLDAFHSTFNFCMNCRQYTCGNCWNGPEGRCLTCAPNLGQEVLQAPFSDATPFEPVRTDAWPEADLTLAAGAAGPAGFPAANGASPDLDALLGSNGTHSPTSEGLPGEDGTTEAWADADGVEDHLPEIDPAARLAFLSGEAIAAVWPTEEPGSAELDGAQDIIGAAPRELTEAAGFEDSHSASDASVPAAALAASGLAASDLPGPSPAEGADSRSAEDAAAVEAVAAQPGAAEAAADVAPEALPAAGDARRPDRDSGVDALTLAAAAALAAASPSADATETLPDDVGGRAAAMTARTSDLLARFRPGQNIDAELAAYEAQLSTGEQGAANDAPADAVSGAGRPDLPVARIAAVGAVAAATAEAGDPSEETATGATAPAADSEADHHRIAAAAALAAGAATGSPEESRPATGARTSRDAIATPAQEARPSDAETESGSVRDSTREMDEVAASGVAEAPGVAAAAELAPAKPVAAEPAGAEPVAAEPAAAERVAAEPVVGQEPVGTPPEPVREDRVEQPTWRIYAPDGQDPNGAPTTTPGAGLPAGSIPARASGDPEWPARADIDESPSMALLANRDRASSEAMWAASAREVAARPGGASVPAATAAVQPCSNCGLSLSATARFCRRCGTRQG